MHSKNEITTAPFNGLKNLYKDFNNLETSDVQSVYADDIQFKDPVHEINGLESMVQYFEHLKDGLADCRFEFNDEVLGQNEGFITWDMIFAHTSLGQGKEIRLSGVSHLRYRDKIYFHEDYYDLGAMVYEHIPLLSFAVKHVKSRLRG